MATVTKPIALDESLNTTEATPRNIADVLAEGIGDLIHAVSQIAPQTVYDLDDLGDVDITSPSNGQVLKYNGTSQKWENGTGGGSGDSVSWTQIQQTGTKIAEIEINGVSTDVYAPTGGGFSALLVITAGTGLTVTASKGGDSYTATEISTGTYEVSVDSAGTWTVSDGSNTATVAVSASTTYYVTLSSVPDGKTVTPTDDVQILLACAGITDKSYTTLTELFADTTTLASVIADNNAIDYLKRSTTFAKQITVPIMTSNTTPSGEVIYSDSPSSRPAYYAFDNNQNTTNQQSSDTTNPYYVGYDFGTPVKVNRAQITNFYFSYSGAGTRATAGDIVIQGGNDNSVWTDLSSAETFSSDGTSNQPYTADKTLNNTSLYRYYRMYVFNRTSATRATVAEVQFYSEEGFTDNATAMSYIGLNNYASNTLLADSTWCSAICNSTYFESVLNVKVPAMTSDTTPSGECISSGSYGSDYNYKAFDGNTNPSSQFNSSDVSTGAGAYIGYTFPSKTKVIKADCIHGVNTNISTTINLKYQSKTASGDWNDVSDSFNVVVNDDYPTTSIIINGGVDDVSYRLYKNSASGNTRLRVVELQFYGRADI